MVLRFGPCPSSLGGGEGVRSPSEGLPELKGSLCGHPRFIPRGKASLLRVEERRGRFVGEGQTVSHTLNPRTIGPPYPRDR